MTSKPLETKEEVKFNETFGKVIKLCYGDADNKMPGMLYALFRAYII